MRYIWQLLVIIILSYSNHILASDSDIDKLKSYLINLKPALIEFVQINKSAKANGMIVIDQNNNFRVNYFDTIPLLITGNAKFVSSYDYDLQQSYNISRRNKELQFLIFDEESINNMKIDNIVENQDYIEYLVSLNEREASLIFSKTPYKIDEIIVRSIDNEVIETHITNIIKPRQTLDKKLFQIKNPKIFGPPQRFSKKDLLYKGNI